jgi:hypothetical protein
VTHAHDDFFYFGVFVRGYGSGYFEAVWKRSVGAGERVVSRDGDILGDTGKHALAVVLEGRSLSVENLASDIYSTSIAVENALPMSCQYYV